MVDAVRPSRYGRRRLIGTLIESYVQGRQDRASGLRRPLTHGERGERTGGTTPHRLYLQGWRDYQGPIALEQLRLELESTAAVAPQL